MAGEESKEKRRRREANDKKSRRRRVDLKCPRTHRRRPRSRRDGLCGLADGDEGSWLGLNGRRKGSPPCFLLACAPNG